MSDNHSTRDKLNPTLTEMLRRRTALMRAAREKRYENESLRSAEGAPDGGYVRLLEKGYSFPAVSADRHGGADPYEQARKLAFPVRIHQPATVQSDLAALQARFPHALAAVHALAMADLTRMTLGVSGVFRPILLVGPPGCGKSTLARVWHKMLGYPCMTMNVAALSDVMAFTGTHPTYSNPKPSVIVDYMARHEIANPCIILDEIDKSPEGGRNGSIKNVLLQFLEPGEARTFRDICLNAEVDLSRVRWVMTANVLERVPLPLRSRCQIVHVPSPDRKHAIGLSRQMAEAILTEMGLDRRWITFDGVEEVLLQEHFRGDLRHLRMMVDLFIRERLTSLTMC